MPFIRNEEKLCEIAGKLFPIILDARVANGDLAEGISLTEIGGHARDLARLIMDEYVENRQCEPQECEA